jgi:DNA modification methylase
MLSENIKLDLLLPNTGQVAGLPANPRFIKNEKFRKLKKSIQDDPEMLELREIVAYDNGGELVIIMGNMRYRALVDLGFDEAPVKVLPKETPVEKLKAMTIKDNVGFGEWDHDILANEWNSEDLDDWGVDVWQDDEVNGNNNGSIPNSKTDNSQLTDRFVIPPFSILDTRKGYWQKRKAAWHEFIGDMGESRDEALTQSLGEVKAKEVKEKEASNVLSHGFSLSDPVLSEIMCRWFTHEKGCKVFDCFAGDTEKGLVIGECGYEFTGIELRSEQVDINNRIIANRNLPIRYICDDGQNILKHFEPESQDMLFSCPPYYDLEVYSDNPNDASNQKTYTDFLQLLRNAYSESLKILKQDRFSVIVVGNVRDKETGFYRNLVDDVKRIFFENDVLLYNDLILIETSASATFGSDRYMENRKIVKTHQNVLIFYKGDPKRIKDTFPKIEFTEDDKAMFSNEISINEE